MATKKETDDIQDLKVGLEHLNTLVNERVLPDIARLASSIDKNTTILETVEQNSRGLVSRSEFEAHKKEEQEWRVGYAESISENIERRVGALEENNRIRALSFSTKLLSSIDTVWGKIVATIIIVAFIYFLVALISQGLILSPKTINYI